MRDIDNYTENYLKPGFEEWQVRYRRKKVLEIIENCRPRKILEIGCGMEPLFTFLPEGSFNRYVIVEPSREFYDNAQKLAKERMDNIVCINDFFTSKVHADTEYDFDMIICSSLLHELEKPENMMEDIRALCTEKTVVHINVPNANSFHRVLAKKMGLIKDEHEMTERNTLLQQNRVFDLDSLQEFAKQCGFEVLEKGTYFVKPFSHAQMEKMMEHGIADEKMLDGLYQMTEIMPDMGSECYINCIIL